jgi:uncharacterized protein YbaP (TraB family)
MVTGNQLTMEVDYDKYLKNK